MLRRYPSALAVLVLFAGSLSAVEHPGVVPTGVECASCHSSKVTGKFVHSAMGTSCSVCHVTSTQGDMTTVSLSMPKDKICSACHTESATLRQHVPSVKGSCIDCHDAHSSSRRMMLRELAAVAGPKRK